MSIVTSVLGAVFWGLLLLSAIVVVHEFGHYLVARAFGVRVTEFFIGLPCRWKISFKNKSNGTEFGATPLLLGGYNRICGMEGVQDDLMPDAFAIVQREGRVKASALADELGIDLDRAYAILAGLCDCASIRPYFDPSLGEVPTQRDYPEAFETLARDPNMLTEYDKGHDFSLEGSSEATRPRPLANPAEELDRDVRRTYAGISYPKRLAILVAGPLVNLLLAFVLITVGYMTIEYHMVAEDAAVGAVEQGSLAEAAGLRAGDRIVRVAGKDVDGWQAVVAAIAEARQAGEDFSVTYVRDGREGVATIDLPQGQEVEYIGVSPQTQPYHLSLPEAAQEALGYAQLVGSTAVKLIWPQHTMEVLDQSSSIVGISVMAAQAASTGIMDVLALVAAISMSLGFINLLPIPPLDGGKILVETIQAIIRRPLPQKALLAFNYVGIAFFAFIFVFVLRNDIVRLMG